MSEKYVPAEMRRLVIERANSSCEYCRAQSRYSSDPFTIDHIIPFVLGGLTVIANLAFCCYGCNQCKGARTFAIDPVTGLIAPLFHPRRQHWEEHFAWNDDFTLIIGLTATGSSTIEALQLNRPGLVNLRRVLYFVGEHPPNL